jgi:Domain of unknown function (DU1801)
MTSKAELPEDYIDELPDDRKQAITAIREAILGNLPQGFQEIMNYGMLGYVVPHSIYPGGYHCTPNLPLPFMGLASQKNFIALYHMGIYADKGLFEWFTAEYPKHCKTKLDIGKSCIRFKKIDDVPVKLIGELASKMSVQEWIALYEKTYRGAK